MTKHDNREWFFLIVDDLQHQRAALIAAIRAVVPRSQFIEAEALPQAKEIVEAKTDHIDLAVIDLCLTPGGTEGIELIETIKRTGHRDNLRTILITAFPRVENSKHAKTAGADGFISKLDCSDTQELQEMVQQLLGLNHMPKGPKKPK